ncbi:MAG: hypothetical protein JWM93_952 [Frankiales bacterium]|nr:hypothetical protein [Frankiales bacterium]
MTEHAHEDHPILVVGPDGHPVDGIDGSAGLDAAGADGVDPDQVAREFVEHPAKVMRIGSMIKGLLEEVRAAPLDDASRARLREIHASSIRELGQGLSPELRDELDRLTLPFGADEIPSDSELRIAQAQLAGWLEGLFHGIQTALFAQQMAARVQLDEIRRRALPAAEETGPAFPSRSGGPYL